MENELKMICSSCRENLVLADMTFSYLGKNGSVKTPRCPSCGRVYISEELREGYIHTLEFFLEEASLQGGGRSGRK